MIYIKKFRGTNYFLDRVFVDSISFDKIMDGGFPVLDWLTEREPLINANEGNSVLLRQYGSFDIKFSLIDSTKSTGGKSVNDFFKPLGDFEDCFFMVIIKAHGYTFCGVSDLFNTYKNFNLISDGFYIRLFCIDIFRHFVERCKLAPLSSLNFANGDRKTFEQYIPFHFSGLTSGVVNIGLPSQTYKSRLANYGNPAEVFAYGDLYNFINDKPKISRWETFLELTNGLGFTYTFDIMPGTEETSEPEFILNIIWLKDLENETPHEIENAITHNVEYTRYPAKYLYIRYRSLILSGVDYSNGILISRNDTYSSDANNGNNQLYPCLLSTLEDKILSYDNGSSAEITAYRDLDFRELELKMYPYSFSSGGGIGKLYPLNEADGGGMAYAYIFKAITGQGTNIDAYNNKPIQAYAVENYKRFIRGWAEEKQLTLTTFRESDPVYDVFTNIKLMPENENYYVSGLQDLNFQDGSIKVFLSKY